MSEYVKKDKVGIVTLYHDNYNFGALLQAYALPIAIYKFFDLNAEQIDYVNDQNTHNGFMEDRNRRLKFIGVHNVLYNLGIMFFSKILEKYLVNRKKIFEKFMKEIPHTEKTYNSSTISSCIKKFTVLICGGDQIWNDSGNESNLKVYTLQFASDSIRKISYAPSMAILETTEHFKEIMRDGMQGLSAISIREKRSLPVLELLTDKKIEIVVDPVLLLEREDWEVEAVNSKVTKKYILCYFLGDNEAQRKAVKKLAKRLHLSILTFPHIFLNVVRRCDLFFGDIYDYSSGPREFIGLIKNADFVITDSFHACVFSLIFEKPFVVFERNRIGEKGNMNSRIYDFLEEYHLESQLVTESKLVNMDVIPNVDFTYALEHWKKRRRESLEYLGNALIEK